VREAYKNADFVYAKSWGSLDFYQEPENDVQHRQQFKNFSVNQEKMSLTNNAFFSHCLPLRRNIQASDAVMNADYCLAIDEAENRLHVQKALLLALDEQNTN